MTREPLTLELLTELVIIQRLSRREVAERTGWSKAQVNKKMGEFDLAQDNRVGRPSWNSGQRDPAASRNRQRAARWSKEHREKLAAAKRDKRGAESNRWRGGRAQGGYKQIKVDGRYVYVHRAAAERLLGRKLRDREQVHHMDHDRKNNMPANMLVLMEDDHARLHGELYRNPALDQRGWLRANDIWFVDLGELDASHHVDKAAA
jgi:hypothetical protein